MATSRQQRLMLVAVCCSLAAVPGFAERMGHQDFAGPPELSADPCNVADPGDPHQILGPNPTHAGCLTALYPPLVPDSSSAYTTTGSSQSAESESFLSLSMAGTLWLYVVGIGMLVLAGFNSRKRHRHLPAPRFPGALDQAAQRQIQSEGSRRNDD